MSFTLQDVLDGVRASRRHFLKHLEGLTEDQWTWKPYPECKSITELVAHLITDDCAALFSLQTGLEPNYEELQVEERDPQALLARLEESHRKLVSYIGGRWPDAALGGTVNVWGHAMKLGSGIAYLSSEDYYHAGQVTFIRLATDPEWDYYGTIYAPEETEEVQTEQGE